jgi:hypothetical protein
MRSFDKLHSTITAALCHGRLHKVNRVYDAAMWFESYVYCEFLMQRFNDALYANYIESRWKNLALKYDQVYQ